MKYKQFLLAFMLTLSFASVSASGGSDNWLALFNSLSHFKVVDEREVGINNINYKYGQGWTRLHTATINGSALRVKEYLEQPGVDTNIQDDKGKTPLHHAIQSGNISMIVLLRRSKASFRVSDSDGKLPLDYASEETKQKLRNLKVIDYYLR